MYMRGIDYYTLNPHYYHRTLLTVSMEEYPLPSPIPPAHLRNERSFRTCAVQRPSQNYVGNNSRGGHHGKEGRRSGNPHRTNSPKIGYSQSHSQGFSRPSSPSPTRFPVAVPSRTRSPAPVRQLVFAQGVTHQQTSPEVIIPRATRVDQNKNNPTTIINRSHSHRPDHPNRISEIQRSGDEHHDRPRSQQRTKSTDPVYDLFPERSGSRQGFVQRFTTRIPSRSRSRQNRAPTPVIMEPSIYLHRGNNNHPYEPPSSECLTGDEVNQASIQGASAKIQHTLPSDVEDGVSQEGRVAANQDRKRQAADGEKGQVRSMAERDGRIRALEDELAAIRGELESERQRRMSSESQIQVQRSEKQSRMTQTEHTNQLGDIIGNGDLLGGKELAEKQDRRRNEKESKWNELQSDIKNMQEVLVEVRGQVGKTSIEAEPKSTGLETAIEELRRDNAQQRDLLNSLTEFWRADFARWQNESISSQEKATLHVQTYLDGFSKTLIGEVGGLREERRAAQYELGSLLCMKSNYSQGGEFDPEWQEADSSFIPPPPELPVPPDLPQPSKPSWRSIYPRLGRRK